MHSCCGGGGTITATHNLELIVINCTAEAPTYASKAAPSPELLPASGRKAVPDWHRNKQALPKDSCAPLTLRGGWDPCLSATSTTARGRLFRAHAITMV